MAAPRPHPLSWALGVVGLVVLGGCRGTPLSLTTAAERGENQPSGSAGAPDTPGGNPPAPVDEDPDAAVTTEVEAGVYADDERVASLMETWRDRVLRAVKRLRAVTGLGFSPTAPPRVILAALRDEHVAFEVRADVASGIRTPVVRVNIEPLAAGSGDPDRALLRALASAVFEDTSLRHGSVAPWLRALAETSAAGDVEPRLGEVSREVGLGHVRAGFVTVEDPLSAGATGVAGLLLLLEHGGPEEVRRFLAFAADGDDPNLLISRAIRDPSGEWVGAARQILEDRLSDYDSKPWAALAAAESALADAGRAGLLAALPEVVPETIDGEVRLLRARAAADEGDFETARRELRSLTKEGTAGLRDPAAALALRVEAESRPGGDPSVVPALMLRLERDFPKSGAAARIRAARPTAEEPLRGLAALREEIERDGTASMDLPAAERYVRLLLLDERSGAAQGFLQSLGDRSLAPELADVSAAVAAAERAPAEEALRANRLRVEAWLVSSTAAAERSVRDGGGAATEGLAERLAGADARGRAAIVRLMAWAGGAGRAVPLLAPSWRERPGLLEGDLDALAGAVRLQELRIWVEGTCPEVREREGAALLWGRIGFELDPGWLDAHPELTRDFRSPEYPVRRKAFDLAVEGGVAARSPTFVARALADPATMLRREAARVAGVAGFEALAREATRDPAANVRQAAAGALARAAGVGAAPDLLALLASDPSQEVRGAAALSLLDVAPTEPSVLDALVATQAEGDPRVREPVAAALPTLPGQSAAAAVSRALTAEAARPEPRSPVLYRLFLLIRRLGGPDLGYYPGMPVAEARRLAAKAVRFRPAAPGGAER